MPLAKPFSLYFYLTLIVLMSSCLGPQKINKWVSQHYAGTNFNAPVKKKEDVISISTPLSFTGNQLSHTEKKTSKLLPLLFYWQYDYLNTCTLNPQIPVSDFTAAAMAYTRTTAFKQKLNGQKLALTIDKIPGSFSIDDKGHIIWIIYAFAWDNVTIKNIDREMQVSYRVLNGDTEIKKGTVTVTGSDKEVPLQMFQSLKRKTKEFLVSYDAGIKALSKIAMDKILSEL